MRSIPVNFSIYLIGGEGMFYGSAPMCTAKVGLSMCHGKQYHVFYYQLFTKNPYCVQ